MPNNPKDVLPSVTSRLMDALRDSVMIAEAQRANERNRIPEYVAAKIAREHAIRGAISESCAEWVKSGRFPLMDPETSLFFYDRLFFALALSRWLSQSAFSWRGDESKLLAWLLIDSWERISCLNWKYSLENPS